MYKHITTIKKHITFDTILIVLLGVCVGLYIKSLAAEKLTVGHSDPAIAEDGELYDIDKVEQELISRGIPPEIEENVEKVPTDTSLQEGSIETP